MSPLKVNYGNDGANPDDAYGLEAAHRLVKSIFHQITEGDAPSGNFENFDNNNNIHSLVGRTNGSFYGGFSKHGDNNKHTATSTTATSRASLSNHSGFTTSSDNQSTQSDGNDVTSACTPSEPSILSSCSDKMLMSPVVFATPKPTTTSLLRLPPRPPPLPTASSSSQLSDASNHSSYSRDWNNNCAPSYSIGASLMGVNSLADYCSRTMQLQQQQHQKASSSASGRKLREQREASPATDHHNSNHNLMSGVLPPPSLFPLESEESSSRDEVPKAASTADQTTMQINQTAFPTDHRSPTPRIYNGVGKDAPTSLALSIASCDDQGFPHNGGMDKENNRKSDIQLMETLHTDTSWTTEAHTFSFEDAIGELVGDKNTFGEDPSMTAASDTTFGRAASPMAQRVSSAGYNSGSKAVPKRRIMMFGSEYARILSLSMPLSQSSTDQYGTTSRPNNKAKRSSSAVSNKIKAKLSMAENHASSMKESVESGGGGRCGVMSLDECPHSVATAAITDVIITSGSDLPPRGYYRAFSLGEEVSTRNNMVPGGRKQSRLYLNVKKEPSWERAAQRPCVTAFCVIYPDRNEFVPPGFSVVRLNQPNSTATNESGKKKKEGGGGSGTKSFTQKHDEIGSSESPAANINPSSTGERVYICYRRSREGNPITGVVCLRPTKGDLVPEGYTVLERTPRNFVADMAAKQDAPLFLGYRQRLANLECLRPLPLVLSADRTELKAYYCTGCTVVPSDVGRFHIMDRSTHTLMSSSSAKSRLNLIQSSREESEMAVPAWVSSTSARDASPMNNIQNTPISVESPCQENDYASDSSLASFATSNSSHPSPSLSKSLFRSDHRSPSDLDALDFIPPIECSKRGFHVDDASHSESVLQCRIAAITPILTSCYTSQGGTSLLAVEGLITLLNETDFFSHDVEDEDCNARLTILDLTIQVVCDVATSSARETYFRSCVDFVSDAVRYAQGKLNDRTVGYVLRFYLFVFYFGASVSTNGWPFQKARYEDQVGVADDSLLSETIDQTIECGAPQAAAIAMKEFISIMLCRIGRGLEGTEQTNAATFPHARQTPPNMSEKRVDVTNYTQLAMYQIHRSGGSELFWHDMTNSIGHGLFRQDSSSSTREIVHSNIISFAILASIVKNCSGKVRLLLNSDPVPRDVASKLLSFELLSHFLKIWPGAEFTETDMDETTMQTHDHVALSISNDDNESVSTMTYIIQRLVVPTLLSNTSAAIEDYRVYRRVLRIVSQLWRNPYYRSQMKVELAILIEHFVLKVLSLGPQVHSSKKGELPTSSGDLPSLLQQQLDVLEELKAWFSSNSTDVLSLHLNYDNYDMLPGSCCRLMNKLCEALSTLAEQSGTIISEHGRSATFNGGETCMNVQQQMNLRESAQLLRKKSFDAITVVAKSWMDCAASSCTQAAVAAAASREETSSIDEQSTGLGLSPKLSQIVSFGDENIVDYWKTSIEKRKAPLQPLWVTSSCDNNSQSSNNSQPSTVIKSSMSEESSNQVQNKQELDTAFEVIAAKGLKKGIDYLIAIGLLIPSPRHISAFLRIHLSSIDPCILGEYLGEGGVDGSDIDFFNLIRFNFTRATSFVGMNIEQALRHFLTNCGFHLPGEAQKIDRIVSVFSQCYWEDNAGDLPKCPFPDQDTVFLVSFAIIMLNTDLHKSYAGKGKTPKRMTKTEFITNLRGVFDGVHKFQDYIYSIYDSIESSPIVLSDSSTSTTRIDHEHGHYTLPFKDETDLTSAIVSWVKSVEPAQELLRTVAVRHEDFVVTDDNLGDEATLKDLTYRSFSANWHHIHAAINSTIDNAHVDIAGLGCCIDVLEYSLCAASYLDKAVERSAFSKLLCRVNRFNNRKGRKYTPESEKISTSINFEDVDQVRSLTKRLHSSLSIDDEKINTMKEVAGRIRNGDILLNDPSRAFVREGDLIKRHQLAARSSTYHFFLFSDVLVYAHKSNRGDYKVHEELPLHLMKIEDAQSIAKQNSFHIHHPNKSFIVMANDSAEKQQWMEAINDSIRRELKRKAKIEKSRIEAARRAEF